MRKTNCILIIVAILGILFVFSLFNKEGIVINVNSRNKDLVYHNIGFTLIGIYGLIMFYLFVCKYVNKKR